MPIYLGPRSVYARKEGIYVKPREKPGIDTIKEAAGILYLILRDFRRGWSYNQHGKKVKMTPKLFALRVRYVFPLSRKHGASKREQAVILKLINHVLANKSLPKDYAKMAKAQIVKVR